MARRRLAYPAVLALICAFVLSAVGSPAAAADVPGPAPTAAAGPKSVNVKPGAKPPVARKKGGASPSGCGAAAMRLGKIYSCPSLTGTRQDTFTVTTTVDNDSLYGTFLQTSNSDVLDYTGAMLYDADGNYLCYYSSYPGKCQLGAAGTYTLTVALSWGVGDLAYTFSVQSLKTPSACRSLPASFFSWASTGRTGELPRGSAGDCYAFNQPTGTVLQMWPSLVGEVVGGDFQPLCSVQYATQCTLTSPGPYHVVLYDMYGNAASYKLRMARISHSSGCPELTPATFGDPGRSAGSGSLAAQGDVACHKLRTPAAGGVLVRIYNSQSIWWYVYDDAGRQICDKYANSWSCDLPAAGAYTIITGNQDWEPITYQIGVTALHRPAGCSTLRSLAWDRAAVVLNPVSAVQADCQQFRGTAGQRVVIYSAATVYNQVFTTIVDSAGKAVCLDYTEETGCALPADGTYRAISYLSQFGGDDHSYKTQVRSLSAPTGCPVITVGAYNGPPSGAYGPIRCRILRVTEPGVLQIRAYDDENYRQYAAVYDRTGHRICDDSGYCEFTAAGDYAVVLNAQNTGKVIDNDFSYVVSALPAQPAGCPDLTQELYQGAFGSPGQYLCVKLPQASGSAIAELVPTDARYPFTYVMDSAGNYLCDSSYQLWQTSCRLTGTAPYYAVLSQQSGETPKPFAARFVRVDGPSSCPALDTTAVTTGGDTFLACRTIPADSHGTSETFTWHQTSGTGGAYLSIFDATGTRYCGPTGTSADRTVTCRLPAGPLTLILNAASTNATYEITHQPTATS